MDLKQKQSKYKKTQILCSAKNIWQYFKKTHSFQILLLVNINLNIFVGFISLIIKIIEGAQCKTIFKNPLKRLIHALKILIIDFINIGCQQHKSNISSLILYMCKCHHYSVLCSTDKKMSKDLKPDKGNLDQNIFKDITEYLMRCICFVSFIN